MAEPSLTADRLRELLIYDQDTGVFVWRTSRGPRKSGAVAGTNCGGCLRMEIDGKQYALHCLAIYYVTGVWPGVEVLHINDDKFDNRYCNLLAVNGEWNPHIYLTYEPENGIFRHKFTRSGQGAKKGSASGWKRPDGYFAIRVGGREYRAHWLAWYMTYGKWPTFEIDHIDGDPSNNRIANLREATSAQNKQNQRRPHSNNKSGFLGVCRNRHGKWIAQIKCGDLYMHLGSFDSAIAAHDVYVDAKRKFHSHNTL